MIETGGSGIKSNALRSFEENWIIPRKLDQFAGDVGPDGSRPVSRVLSRVTIPLGHASPRTSSDLPESSAGHTIRFLFGLAPGGVYHAGRVTTNAVRSYHTISPLPDRRLTAPSGGIFSVALSIGSRRPDVIWHPALWSPDFPPPCTVSQLERWLQKQDRGHPAGSQNAT